MAIENALRWVVLTGIFAIPFLVFYVAESLFFPFITGKNFAFRIIVEVITGAYLALALGNPLYRPRRSWLLGAFALFVVIVAAADLFGVHPFKSFWSNYERMDGFVTLAHLFLYFVVLASVLNTEKLWRAFWQTSLFVSAIVGLYAFFQLLGIASLSPGFSSATRLDATFGNPIYLAVYMLFNIAIALLLIVQSGKEHWSTWERIAVGSIFGVASTMAVSSFHEAGWILYVALAVIDGIVAWLVFQRRAYLLSLILALNTFVLFLTGTRGTMLGLVGGAFLGALILAWGSREMRRIAVTTVVVLPLLGGVLFLLKDHAVIQSVPFLQRLATISLEDSTTKARFMNWGMAWEGVKERPVLGWGQENYAIVFDKYYNPQMFGQEQWFDRVHNVVFDWLVAAGFLGLLSYLSLFVFALWGLWKSAAFTSYERSILAGLLAAYFFHNLFVFDNIFSYILFASVLAYIAWRSSENSRAIALPQVPTMLLPVAVLVALALVWAAIWFVNIRPIAQNRALITALRPHKEGLSKNFEYLKKSISYGSFGTQEAREQLIQSAVQILRLDGVSQEIKKDFVNTAAAEMALQAASSPLDARFPLFLGALLGAVGDIDNASKALRRAHELSPGKQSIIFELASVRMAGGDEAGALALYKQAYELAPEYLDARLLYAAAAIRAGNDVLGNELLAPVVESGAAADPRIAAAYVARKRYDKIIEIWEARVKASPTESQPYFTLAAAYFATGNSAKAIGVLEAAGRAIPSAKAQADALIGQIRSGTAKIQ